MCLQILYFLFHFSFTELWCNLMLTVPITGRFDSPVKTDDEKVNSFIHNKSPGMNVLLNPDLGEFMSNNPVRISLFIHIICSQYTLI